jgi:polyhydroxyalkanoate synthesis regulator phasin
VVLAPVYPARADVGGNMKVVPRKDDKQVELSGEVVGKISPSDARRLADMLITAAEKLDRKLEMHRLKDDIRHLNRMLAGPLADISYAELAVKRISELEAKLVELQAVAVED